MHGIHNGVTQLFADIHTTSAPQAGVGTTDW
jgi:hypothetical protein